jgi:uncharacterized protein YprB with RNaseH-like and TPR domain
MEAFLDIETTGLSPNSDQITVIGIYHADGARSKFVQLVGDRVTPENLLESMRGTSVIYTYNGSRFDLPFINRRLGVDIESMYRHCDLMYSCWDNELYGGLKGVEKQLNIPRKLKEMNGYEAVRLWWRYVNSYDEKALSLLLEYNKEDVVNLKTLRDRLL